MKSSIAVLITCFNRKEKTLNCLENLFHITNDVDVYLVDDNSNDGTKEAIKNSFPQVHIISGNGNLFWNRGMHIAWQTAMSEADYDFFLWLNDDSIPYPYLLQELLHCSKLKDDKAIISGLIENAEKTKVIYGGRDFERNLIQATGKMESIRNLNGNVVLVPSVVVKKIGILDPYFHHDLGDVDYGYRAQKNNIEVVTTERPVAYGFENPIMRMRLKSSSLKERIKYLYSPLGANPRINFYFRKKYFGYLNAIMYFCFLHFLNFIPNNLNSKLFGDKYC